MCGIIGIVGHPHSQVVGRIYDGMLVLQHRGQDAAGIVTSDSDNISHRRANGLVRDVFRSKHMSKLEGSMGIGHVRYPTAGSSRRPRLSRSIPTPLSESASLTTEI